MHRSGQGRRRLAGLVLLVAVLAGCSTDNRYTDQGAQLPRSDLSHARPISWNEVEIVDDTHLRVTFWSGVDGCWGHDIEVDETTSAVTISLVTGAIPRAWEGCDGRAVEHTTLVEIAEPLGGRKIVDGNAE